MLEVSGRRKVPEGGRFRKMEASGRWSIVGFVHNSKPTMKDVRKFLEGR